LVESKYLNFAILRQGSIGTEYMILVMTSSNTFWF